MQRSAILLATLVAAWPAAASSDCQVTMEQYMQLRTGMSIANAVAVLGCDGVEMSSNEIAGIQTIMFMWDGTSLGANMNAMFQDDKLVQKAQFGLK